MKNTINIYSSKSRKKIFSYTCENNTKRKTIEEAVNQGIDLKYAYLRNCDLSNLTLNNANLSYADLSFCNLQNIKLTNVNLEYSTLLQSNLSNSTLINVNLSNAMLIYSKCPMTVFEEVDFYYSDCGRAVMNDSTFINVKSLNDQCPKEGSFIGWKKCYSNKSNKAYIVKLEIPTDAKRCSATTNKCRCSKAKVLEIQNIDSTIADVTRVFSEYNKSFIYKVNETIYSDSFDDRYWNECSHGIHFFMNREDAVNYI